MTETRRCSRCGASLRESGSDLCCPACLLRLALNVSPALSHGPGVVTKDGEQIGPYRILQTLAEGGMGIVYLAEQEHPLHRYVALKLIKVGLSARDIVGRFESERQAMALMDHPNIASIFDAGTTPDGRPYFAMEYVPGLPITEYCDRGELRTQERLTLFTRVCAAIQHAHQKGIIHLDLKPSNVLVMEQDGGPVPKVIDFGVAKAIEQRKMEVTLYTEHGLLVGTPEYMSPEQASLGDRALDTRTDIYSLGVLLYELLVGVLPLTIRDLRRAGYDELRRIIREEEPPKPSTRVSMLGLPATDIAAHRDTDVTGLRRQLRGDLDWIAMRALEKDPGRRYASASELAADITRHLENEPIAAGPPSGSYRLKKFVLKHRASVGAVAAVLVVLFAGLVTSTRLYLDSQAARQQAEAEATRNRLDAEALQSALWRDPNKYKTLSELAVKHHREALGDDNPALSRHLVNYLVVSEFALGRWTPELDGWLDEATTLIERGLDAGDTSVIRPLLLLSSESRQVDQDTMARLYRKALELALRSPAHADKDAAAHVDSLARLLERVPPESVPEEDLETALRTARDILERRRKAHPVAPESLARSSQRLSVLLARSADRLLRTGDAAAAEKIYREAVLFAKESGIVSETVLAEIESNVGQCLVALERFAEAEPLLVASHSVLWARLGEMNATTHRARSRIVDLYDSWERGQEAARYRKKFGAVLVKDVRDRGVVRFVPDGGSRGGGYSAAIEGRSIWVFHDSWLPAWRERRAKWLGSSWGALGSIPGGPLTVMSPRRWSGAADPSPLIMPTRDEIAADEARQGQGCSESCGFRTSFWTGPVVWDNARRRMLVFYTKKFGSDINREEKTVGSSVAIWSDLDAQPVRPVLRTNNPEPTLLFSEEEPPWGSGASGALAIGDWLYVYPCSFEDSDNCLLARVPLEHALDRASWRFYTGNGKWSHAWAAAKPVLKAFSTLSVHWNAYLRKYIAISTPRTSHTIELRTADRPEGPWSDAVVVEGLAPPVGFPWIRSALGHSELARDGGRVETLTYVRNLGLLTSEMRVVEIEFNK